MRTESIKPLYGLLAEFAVAEDLVAAAREARDAGYRNLEAYTPFDVEGLAEALRLPRTRIPLITLVGGIVGGVTAYVMMIYATIFAYPVNVGGRPLNSWPAYIPITFELTVLGAAIAAVLGMLICNGLPRLHHPLFNVPEFAAASRNRFFLCIEAADPSFELSQTLAFLCAQPGSVVFEVPE